MQLVDGLQCCSDYRFSVSAFTINYGPTATVMMFRTNPDLSSKPLIHSIPMLGSLTLLMFNGGPGDDAIIIHYLCLSIAKL